MCGILGLIRPGRRLDPTSFSDAMDRLRHRGPDGSGVLAARLRDGWRRLLADPDADQLRAVAGDEAATDVLLGHTRLSIIDLSTAASQPMCNEDADIWVVFNGEIYNHAELRRELASAGHTFRTSHSDTEVLIHGYEQWGEGLVERLRGMYAFAALDLKDRRLFLARDRFGEKPLYVSAGESGVAFASELTALTALGVFGGEICPLALGDYLGHGFIPSPRSIFRGVVKLTPSQCVTIDLTAPAIFRPRIYWTPPAGRVDPLPEARALEEFREELDRTIVLRMQSDVPLGAFLSGGLDSTTVVRHMAKNSDQPINTFTIGFPRGRYDESEYARQAAERYRTHHRVEFLSPDDLLAVLPVVEKHLDEPFADSSAIPTYMVSRIARESVTVALSGDGGDELLSGYGYYPWLHRVGRVLDRLPGAAVRPLARLAHRYYPESRRSYTLINMLEAGEVDRYMRIWVDDFFVRRSPACGPETGDTLRARWSRVGASGVEKMAAVDSQFYIPEDLMVKVDRMSMAVSLEARAPLLDQQLFEAAARIPFGARFDGRHGKLPFRSALEADIGPAFVNRPKWGFSIPLDAWFRGPLREVLRDALLDRAGLVAELLPRCEVERLIERHERGTRDQSARLWRLFALQRWHDLRGRAAAAAGRGEVVSCPA